MAKIINLDGTSELGFIGVAVQKERKAEGLKNRVIQAIGTTMDDPKRFLKKISSICTDETNVNTGDRNSLWTLLDETMESVGSKIPLIKIWCGGHRAELVWGDVGKQFKEIGSFLSTLLSMSSYFHHSSLWTAELQKIGSEYELKVLKIPKKFEIRWTQFSFTLIRNVLFSWKALIIYFERHMEKDAVCVGFHRYLRS